MNIVASGLTAQQLRLDIVGENVTNSTTTRVEGGEGAYRRKMVVFEAKTGRDGFRRAMARAATAHKLYHTTYYNHLAAWVRRCESAEEVSAITYGAELPEDLAEHIPLQPFQRPPRIG